MGRTKLNNQSIDDRLKDRNIKRLDDFVGSHTKIDWKCLVCSYVWGATSANVLFGHGCPQCAGTLPLNNSIIDHRLKDRKIKRLDNYIHSHAKIEWKCLVESCGYIWSAIPTNILSGKGCSVCSKVLPLCNEIIDNRLQNRNIRRLDDYINNSTQMDWECLVCNYVWTTTASGILNKKASQNNSGCAKCSGVLQLTNEVIDHRLEGKNIRRLNNYITTKTKINWECLIESCHYIWNAAPSNILYGPGCPNCNDNIPITNEIVDKRLEGKTIKRLGNYTNNYTKIDWECLVCNYIWSASPSHVLTSKLCPKCIGHIPLTNEIVDDRLKNRFIKRLDSYVKCDVKINWQCLVETCNYIWSAIPEHVLRDTGCPNCSLGKNERIVHTVLTTNNIVFLRHHNIQNIDINEKRRIVPDFYITNKNIIIEYNGAQHYYPSCFNGISVEKAKENFTKQQERDQYLQQFCDANNIILIWIDGRKYTNYVLEKYVTETIIPLLK
jgi:hypothetical protein